MSQSTDNSAEHSPSAMPQADGSATREPVETAEELAYANRPFRGWRLLGVIGIVVLVLAIVSATIDWIVIGPLEGRVL